MPEDLNALVELARRQKNEGHYEAAYRNFEKVLSVVGIDKDTELIVLSSEGTVKFDPAERTLFLNESSVRSQMVDLLRTMGRPKDAVNHALLAYYIDRSYLGDHNNTAASLVDVGLVYCELHKPEIAKKYFDESKRIDQIILKANEINALAHWRSDARAHGYEELGFIVEALKELEVSLPVIKSELSDRQSVVISLNDYSQHLQNLGEHNKAEQILHDAIEEQKKIGFTDHPQFRILYSNLATLHLERGQLDEASKWLNTAVSYSDMSSQQIIFVDEIKRQCAMRERMTAERQLTGRGLTDHDYFISYNVNDEVLVDQLKAEMIKKDVSCWTFKEYSDWQRPRPYETIMDEMKAEIDKSYALLVVASGTSLTSSCVYDEIDYAFHHQIPIMVWYPEGTRVRPLKTALKSDDSRLHLLTVSQKIFSSGVYSYYGSGIRTDVIQELSDALLYRLLLLDNRHKLNKKYRLEELRTKVRHATRMTPYFIDENGNRMFL